MKKMPKSPNIIQFSLPTEVREKLEAMGSGESVALVAKRVLLEALGDNPSAIAAPSSDALTEIQERLEKLEAQSGDRPNDDLTQISYRLELLERDLDTKGDRLAKIEFVSALPGSTFEDLSQRIDKLCTRISQLEYERATESPALPKKEISQGLTHKEIAAVIGSSERTMQRVAKEKERWPEGYYWSEESKKWFPA
jgi:hypothetical protein